MSDEPEDPRVLPAVLEALPGTHLAIWAAVRRKLPEVHPSAVWRVMANSSAMTNDKETGVWSRKA